MPQPNITYNRLNLRLDTLNGSSRHIYLRIEPENYHDLKVKAEQEKKTLNSFINNILEEFIIKRSHVLQSWVSDQNLNVSTSNIDATVSLEEEIRKNISGESLKKLLILYIKNGFKLDNVELPLASEESITTNEELRASLNIIDKYKNSLQHEILVSNQDRDFLANQLFELQTKLRQHGEDLENLKKNTEDGIASAKRETLDNVMKQIPTSNEKIKSTEYSLFNFKISDNKIMNSEFNKDDNNLPNEASWKRLLISLREGIIEGFKPAMKAGVVAFGSLAVFATLTFGSLQIAHSVNSNIPTISHIVSSFNEQYKVDEFKVNGEGFELTAKTKNTSDLKTYEDVLKFTKINLSESGLLKPEILKKLIDTQRDLVSTAILDGEDTAKTNFKSLQLRALTSLYEEYSNVPKIYSDVAIK